MKKLYNIFRQVTTANIRSFPPRGLMVILFGLLLSTTAPGRDFRLENDVDSVIGQNRYVRPGVRDTLLDIARRNGLGYQDIKLVNPELDTWLPDENALVMLPLQFILPQTDRTGIVLNIPEMRLYYYPGGGGKAGARVVTYPLGIGREGWNTPYVTTRIIEKKKNPVWRPPESIRKEHEAMGDPLPLAVRPGPDNPLGEHAMRLGLPSYLIHGTNKPFGIGMRVSHGCIRLYPEDIKALFDVTGLGTKVTIINQPYKVGQKNGRIYLEAHPFLDEDREEYEGNLTSVVRLLVNITEEAGSYLIDWDLARQVIDEMKGIPVVIGSFKDGGHGPDNLVDDSLSSIDLRMETRLPEAESGT